MFVQGQKNKGIFDIYCGITVLDAAGKVPSRVLLMWLLWNISPIVILESQRSFRSGSEATIVTFLARKFQEKCIEQQVPCYKVFINFTKAFDIDKNVLLENSMKNRVPTTIYATSVWRLVLSWRVGYQLIAGFSREMSSPQQYSQYSFLWCRHTHFSIVRGVFSWNSMPQQVFSIWEGSASSQKIFRHWLVSLCWRHWLTHTEDYM